MNIWIVNHYAGSMFFDRGGRHYYFAKHLMNAGHNVTVFCANTIHNSDKIVEIKDSEYITDTVDKIPFVFVKTAPYKGNGFARIRNMLVFYKNVKSVMKKLADKNKPDVILASSVHPFTCVAGIKTANKLGIPCVVEIRDLWPESIVEYKEMSRKNPVIMTLYALEKWIYKKADKLIFTCEGGADYIKDKGWDDVIDLGKVHHINNGVNLEDFDRNLEEYRLDDEDLNDETKFKVIYTGSIRQVNHLRPIVDAAKILQDKGYNNISLLLYGSGDQVEELKAYVHTINATNIHFKGWVKKKYIPSVLSRGNVSLVHVKQTKIVKYGNSLNKLFDYLAAQKPIISDWVCGYDIIKEYNCGHVTQNQEPEVIADAIIDFYGMNKAEVEQMSGNARKAAKDYDYKKLAEKLIEVLEGALTQ